MAISPFGFTPAQGLRDSTAYPTNPGSEAAARDQVQKGMDQLKDYLNANFLNAAQVLSGGYKIQTASIAFTANANAYTSQTANFPVTFSGSPLAFAQIVQSDAFLGVGTSGETATSFSITVNNTSASDMPIIVKWYAIGS